MWTLLRVYAGACAYVYVSIYHIDNSGNCKHKPMSLSRMN